eukprot:5794630-Ditylum_brightwellii.AAC.1
MEPNQLQTANFVPYLCNAGLEDAVCTPLPADFAGVVPCGVCYSMSNFKCKSWQDFDNGKRSE